MDLFEIGSAAFLAQAAGSLDDTSAHWAPVQAVPGGRSTATPASPKPRWS